MLSNVSFDPLVGVYFTPGKHNGTISELGLRIVVFWWNYRQRQDTRYSDTVISTYGVRDEVLVVPCILRLEALADCLRAIASIDITEQATRACKVVAKVPSARQYVVTCGTKAGTRTSTSAALDRAANRQSPCSLREPAHWRTEGKRLSLSDPSGNTPPP